MSTELEDDLRATFGRAAASVPQTDDLTHRATTGASRTRRRTWLVSAAAAAGVGAVAVTAFALGGLGRPGPTSEPPVAAGGATSAASTPALTPVTVAGTWQPVRMDGFTGLKARRPDNPVLILRADGTWAGSDGCNGLSGTYSLLQRGEFAAKIGPQRLMGCENVPHTTVLSKAKRVSLDAGTLRFYAADGRELAVYAR